MTAQPACPLQPWCWGESGALGLRVSRSPRVMVEEFSRGPVTRRDLGTPTEQVRPQPPAMDSTCGKVVCWVLDQNRLTHLAPVPRMCPKLCHISPRGLPFLLESFVIAGTWKTHNEQLTRWDCHPCCPLQTTKSAVTQHSIHHSEWPQP